MHFAEQDIRKRVCRSRVEAGLQSVTIVPEVHTQLMNLVSQGSLGSGTVLLRDPVPGTY